MKAQHTAQTGGWLTWQSQAMFVLLVGLCVGILAYGNTPIQTWAGSDAVAKPRLQVQSHTGGVQSAVFSPDGQLILTVNGYLAHLWETTTGRELRRFVGHNDLLYAGVFSSDGRTILTASQDKTVRLWDTVTGSEVQRFEHSPWTHQAAALSPDGRMVLTTGEDGTPRLWDVATKRELRRLGGHSYYPATSAVFSPDGRRILTGGADGTARLWDTSTGQERGRFEGHSGWVNSVVFSHNGHWILTSDSQTARLWDADTGRKLHRFAGHAGIVYSAVFSPDDRTVLTASGDETACLWDLATEQALRCFEGHAGPVSSDVRSAVFSPDGRSILTARDNGTARLWDTSTGQERGRFEGHGSAVASASLSPDGSFVLVASLDHTAYLWDLSAGRAVHRFEGHRGEVYTALFSPDGKLVLTTSWDKTARIWDIATRRELRRFEANTVVHSATFSPDGRMALTAGEDGTPRVWDVATGRELQRFEGHTESVKSVVFSPDGRFVLTASRDQIARLWDAATGREVRRFEGHGGNVNSAVFSHDGRSILTASSDESVRLWEAGTGRESQRFKGHSLGAYSAVFSLDDRLVLSTGWDGSARLWDARTGQELRSLAGHTDPVTSASFSPKGNWILTTSWDGTTRLWTTESGRELARLVSFTDGTWVVATPDGRFDTNNLEEIKGLHWIMPDDPLRALPLEIFMRDYYEPRLLPKVLAGKKLPNIRSLAALNRAQPTVEIVGVEREHDAQGRPSETVAVTVSVAGASQEFGLEEQKRRMATGAYDLRLFRDGQLVAQEPPAGNRVTTIGLSAADELQQWRRELRVVELQDGKREIIFKGVRLPRRAGVKEVHFSAYAFNEHRVKSETTPPYVFPIPADLSPRQPRAYLVTVGVNAFEDLRWDLSFAVNDAQQLGQVLTTRLKAQRDAQGQPRYKEVVWVRLTAEGHVDKQGKRHLTKVQANKEQIEAVLKALAGQAVKVEALRGISHTDQLRRANPEDLVILSFSTHGEVDEWGQFYLLPHDIGVNPTESERHARSVSNDHLSAWLQGLDAIDLVMIVDACHSAASVQNAEFKPGPMGSRGLGQLAYDKGMRILTATQPDKPAFETQQIGMGVLTNALVRKGLEQGEADYKPKDQQIWLSEWLSYAAERVPGLHRDWGRKKGKLRVAPKKEAGEPPALQQPALFDFARKRDALIGSAKP